MKLTFVGTKSLEYRGTDGEKNIHVKKGETIEVSDKEAQRLVKDYPGEFAVAK